MHRMFMGEFNHAIDAKGRLIIPTRFREELGDDFVVTRGLDTCLFVFPSSAWSEFESQLHMLPVTKKEARQFTRFLVAGATPGELDKQGRILLPSTLREFAHLEKDVVLAGVIDRIEIWDRDRYTADGIGENMEDIAEKMSELGVI